MRAQASLETVVGLIILLVVAGVVISLVIYYINPEKMPQTGKQLEKTAFLTECESYCKDMSSIEYCRYYFEGDWNKDGLSHQIIKIGKYNWQTCEDRIYCFLVSPCEDRFGTGLAIMSKCKSILCQAYMEKYNDPTLSIEERQELANTAIQDDIDVARVCDMSGVPEMDRWFDTFGSCF